MDCGSCLLEVAAAGPLLCSWETRASLSSLDGSDRQILLGRWVSFDLPHSFPFFGTPQTKANSSSTWDVVGYYILLYCTLGSVSALELGLCMIGA